LRVRNIAESNPNHILIAMDSLQFRFFSFQSARFSHARCPKKKKAWSIAKITECDEVSVEMPRNRIAGIIKEAAPVMATGDRITKGSPEAFPRYEHCPLLDEKWSIFDPNLSKDFSHPLIDWQI